MDSSSQHGLLLIERRPQGAYCQAGDFYIDAIRPVPFSVITHAHADHARAGHQKVLCHPVTAEFIQQRLGPQQEIIPLEYGEKLALKDVVLELLPAGHILGSAQVVIQHQKTGERWILTGDYKRSEDPTCAEFKSSSCDVLITEATFALPVYRWPDPQDVAKEMASWIEQNRSLGLQSVLFAYSLGKAQRLIGLLRQQGVTQTIYVHRAIAPLNRIYESHGIQLGEWSSFDAAQGSKKAKSFPKDALFIAPPSVARSRWASNKVQRSGFVSGWMQLRGTRRREGFDRGFVLSDHCDWPALLTTIEQSGAKHVLATHGKSAVLIRYLQEKGLKAQDFALSYGEGGDDG